ncbi:MAG: tetraacyldisaccharide 4'-kinase [Candidatus Eisenbacteria bacterium]
MAGLIAGPVANIAASIYGAGWDLRRRAYATGWFRQTRVAARVVSIGNLSVGGTGKTTLTLHLAAAAHARGLEAAVVCRSYRPGPDGMGDEEILYRAFIRDNRPGSQSKLVRAQAAVQAGARFILVDDGFSHWPLVRDLDVVLLDRTDLWGGGQLLPAGWLREPRRALQRAQLIVITRLGLDEVPDRIYDEVRPFAPAALLAAGRHALAGLRGLGGEVRQAGGSALLVTATGNPQAVVSSAREAGFSEVTLKSFRDHHWFTERHAQQLLREAGSRTLLLTAKDAVRWPLGARDPRVSVLEVVWAWHEGGAAAEALVFGEGA